MTDTKSKPASMTDFKIVSIDQTKYWSDDIKKQVGKIYTVYLYDASVVTNCCELTPSFELHPLYYSTEFSTHKYSEQVENEIDEEFVNEEPIYIHCSDVDKLEHADMSKLVNVNKKFKSRTGKNYIKYFEEKKEYFTANHIM